MTLNDQLYFVVPLQRDDGSTYAHVHILPISATAYDVHFELLIRAYQKMIDAGPLGFRSAKRFLRAAAASMAPHDANSDVLVVPLLNEVERLSTVTLATDKGWDTLPLAQAVAQNRLEPGDGDEAVNAACFFTAAWHVPPRKSRHLLVDYGAITWGAHTSSSLPTGSSDGPQTSIATANIGATVQPIVPTPPNNHRPSVEVIVGRRTS